MSVPTLFFSLLALAALLAVLLAANIINYIKQLTRMDTNDPLKSFTGSVTRHVALGLLLSLSTIATIVTGVVWIVQSLNAN